MNSSMLTAAEEVLTEQTVRPGLIALFFFVGLAVATYLLWRSMNKQLKRVDAHFADDAAVEEPPAPGTPPAEPGASNGAGPSARGNDSSGGDPAR